MKPKMPPKSIETKTKKFAFSINALKKQDRLIKKQPIAAIVYFDLSLLFTSLPH
ncbi:hypothetical protein KTT_20130 [Tengunoibacter tsumagoiensis]|uniref:Uncharacterized protein n=1 Tax=Tengunoibacter tsumagoiensis TaxID=2014871 RepID=A0A401ZZ73_9CHLR|nr:hypothetical protein KTT_20130 [Tengunoibacter tsumagoiensis]